MFPKHDLRKRIGRFSIHMPEFNNEKELNHIVDLFCQLKIVPVRAEMMFHNMMIEYTAICPVFEEIEPNREPPHYSVIVNMVNGNGKKFKYEMVKI